MVTRVGGEGGGAIVHEGESTVGTLVGAGTQLRPFVPNKPPLPAPPWQQPPSPPPPSYLGGCGPRGPPARGSRSRAGCSQRPRSGGRSPQRGSRSRAGSKTRSAARGGNTNQEAGAILPPTRPDRRRRRRLWTQGAPPPFHGHGLEDSTLPPYASSAYAQRMPAEQGPRSQPAVGTWGTASPRGMSLPRSHRLPRVLEERVPADGEDALEGADEGGGGRAARAGALQGAPSKVNADSAPVQRLKGGKRGEGGEEAGVSLRPRSPPTDRHPAGVAPRGAAEAGRPLGRRRLARGRGKGRASRRPLAGPCAPRPVLTAAHLHGGRKAVGPNSVCEASRAPHPARWDTC